jgi:hypothetical protein
VCSFRKIPQKPRDSAARASSTIGIDRSVHAGKIPIFGPDGAVNSPPTSPGIWDHTASNS